MLADRFVHPNLCAEPRSLARRYVFKAMKPRFLAFNNPHSHEAGPRAIVTV
jgi:hypothetical protein